MLDRVEMRERLLSAPSPTEGAAFAERTLTEAEAARFEDVDELKGTALAKAILLVCEENPSLLNVPGPVEDPTGVLAANNRKPLAAILERWPDFIPWFGRLGAFEYGWAHNAARFVMGVPLVRNPVDYMQQAPVD
jgi:hypothetical protein